MFLLIRILIFISNRDAKYRKAQELNAIDDMIFEPNTDDNYCVNTSGYNFGPEAVKSFSTSSGTSCLGKNIRVAASTVKIPNPSNETYSSVNGSSASPMLTSTTPEFGIISSLRGYRSDDNDKNLENASSNNLNGLNPSSSPISSSSLLDGASSLIQEINTESTNSAPITNESGTLTSSQLDQTDTPTNREGNVSLIINRSTSLSIDANINLHDTADTERILNRDSSNNTLENQQVKQFTRFHFNQY